MKWLIILLLLTSCTHQNDCEKLGCPLETQVVASWSGEVYHECSSSYAKRISMANLLCFSSEEKAEELGFRPSNQYKGNENP